MHQDAPAINSNCTSAHARQCLYLQAACTSTSTRITASARARQCLKLKASYTSARQCLYLKVAYTSGSTSSSTTSARKRALGSAYEMTCETHAYAAGGLSYVIRNTCSARALGSAY